LYIERGEGMGLKVRGASKAIKGIKQLAEGVKTTPSQAENPNRKKQRTTTNKPLTPEKPLEQRKTREFESITIVGSKGQKYSVVVPASYVKAIPKIWEWTEERYKVAELIAEGMPLAQIPNHPEVSIKSRMVIYGWLEHPEFKEHVDALVMESGWANRRERLANLQHINKLLLNKLTKEIDSIKISDKSLGAILSALQAGSKLIAQEKGEFIEESKVTQDTNISGTLGTVQVTQTFDQLMEGKTEDERKALEKEFEAVGDEIIRSLTGEKDKN
jgi:hypothetical protein